MKKIIVLLAFVSVFAGAAVAQAEGLGIRQWRLVQLDGAPVDQASRAYLELNLDQTRFTGHTGCNRMSGMVDIRGRRIDLLNIATTKMACVEPRARRVETRFVRALENADRFRVTGNSLELLQRNRVVGRLRAMTKQTPNDGDPRIGLEGLKWVLDAIKGVPVSKLGRGAFAVFNKGKGSVGGDSSCNVFGGSYTASGRALKITEVISTMRACVEDERMTIERQFLDGLQQADRYDIAGRKLMLYRNDRLLLTLVGENK